MNLLFVYPEFEPTFWSWKYLLKFVKKAASFVPLALITVAALFPKEWQKKLVDLNARKLKDKDIVWADIVVISGMIGQGTSIKEVVARCVKLGKKVLLGGPILELRETCDEFPGVSHYFLGKGLRTVGQFLADMKQRIGKRIYFADEFPSINESPIPLYELVDPRDYSSCATQDSWACPHECDYCRDRVVDGFRWQQKSLEMFLCELDAAYRRGFRGAMQIFSANFVGNIKKAKALLQKIIEWQKVYGYPFEFTVEASILIARDQELMDLMVQANIKKVFLGLETDNEECLRECKKWQNIGLDLGAEVDNIWQAGLIPMSGYMIFGSEDPKTFADRMIAFIQRTCVMAMVGTAQAQPGTALWDKVKDRFLGNSRSNTAFLPNFKVAMPSKILAEGFARILETIYSPKIYYERIRSSLKKYGICKRPVKKLSWEDFMAFMRANWWIGLVGIFCEPKMSYYYWKSLAETFFSKKRRAFADVVAFWIYEVHFKRTTGEEVKLAKAYLSSQE